MDQQNPFLKLAQPTSANPFSAPQKVEPTVQTNPFLGLKAPAPAPVTTQKYFAAVDNTGSYGFSDEFDASGRPFFAYRNVGDTSTTTDRTRVATPFDPRAAKPVTRDDFYNPRAVENRAELKKQMGGDYSDELDHRIALALSGSNDTQNLKNIPKEENQSYGKLERAYQEKVIKGELSLFDAQVQMARAKKMQDPWTGDKLPEDSITGNYLNAISNAISGTTAKLFFDKTGGFMKEAPTKGTKVPLNKQVINPSQKKESTEEIRNTPEKKIPGGAVGNVVYNMYKDTKAAIDDEADRIVELFKSSEKGVADRVSGLLNVAAGAANIGFSPVSSILEQAKNAPDQVIRMKNGETIAIPSAGKGAAQGISFLFEKVAEGSKEEVKQVLKVLPFSDETKQKIEPALTEIATLINGLVLGEAAPRAIPRVKEITRNVGEVLKKEAVKISKIPGKEGGYIRNPFEKEKLEQEATKYKSAEEFVKAQGTPVYHGTADKFDTFKDDMKGSITGAQSAKGAIWFTEDPVTAKAYSVYASESGPTNKLLREHKILEDKAKRTNNNLDWEKVYALEQKIEELDTYDARYQRRLENANVKDAIIKGDFLTVDAKGKSPHELAQEITKDTSVDLDIDSWLQKQLNKARSMKKDGVKFINLNDAVGHYDQPATHYAIFDAKNVKTKDELIGIYKKSNEASVKDKGVPEQKGSLEQEATKYKSAEEFVKAKSEPLYEFNNYKTIKDKYIARGTVKEAINDIGGIKNVSRGTVYVSDLVKTENVNLSSERARQVSREVKSGVITPLVINEYGEVLDGHHRLAIYKELGIKEIPVIAPKGTEFVKPISKSQLTDIWEKANKDKGATAEADINKLVATKDVAEVKRILKDDFNYPQGEIDKVAPVIAKLSSPRNIKSILEGFDTKAPRIESAPTKIIKQSPARDLAMTEVSMRFETAEKGSRVFTAQEKGGGSDVTAIRSSFPDFISEDLRSRELFDKVLPYYEKGIRPKTARLGRLYDEMQKATDQFERQYEFEATGKLLEPAQKLEKQIATKEKVYEKKPTETGKKELATLKKQSEVIKSAKKEATASARTTQKELRTKQTEEKKAIVDQRSKVIENTYKDVPPIDQETALFQSLADQLASKSDDVKSLPEIIATKATSVKEKVNLFDRFLKTPDRVLEKIGLKKEADLVRHSYESYITELPAHIDLIKEWKEQVTPEGNKKIFKFLDGQLDFAKDPLTKVEAKIAGEIKEYLSDWAERLGLPDDARLSNYITHIFEEDFIKKEFDEDLAKIIQEKIPGQVYDPFLEKRLGAKGYVEDTFRAVQAYAKRAVRKSNMDPALAALKEASKNLEQSQFNYVKEYADRVNMRPTEVDNLLDNGIKQVISYKLGQRPTATITKTLRQMTSRGAFGLNFGTALLNLTQGVNTYSKLGEKYTAIGYTKLLTEWNNKELIDSGILKQDIIQDKTVTALNKNLERIDKGLFYMFETAEKINRGAAYFGAKAKAIAEGKSELEAIQYAKKVVRDTQFQFGSIDTPVGLQSDVAKTLTQFGTFSVKQLEFLKEMGTNKEWAGLIRYALASTLIVATVGNAFNIKAQDFIPLSYFSKFGTPPSFRFPLEIVKAIIGTPDAFGKPRDMEKKASDVLNSAVTYAPAGAQIQKTYRGLSAYEDGKVEKTTGNLVKAALLGKTNLIQKQETDPLIKEAADKKKQTASDFRPTYNKVQELIKQGKMDEAKAIVDSLSDKDYETYKTFKQIEKTKDTTKKMNEMVPTYKKVQDLVKSGKTDEAKAIVEAFSDEEYRVYQLLKKRLSE